MILGAFSAQSEESRMLSGQTPSIQKQDLVSSDPNAPAGASDNTVTSASDFLSSMFGSSAKQNKPVLPQPEEVLGSQAPTPALKKAAPASRSLVSPVDKKIETRNEEEATSRELYQGIEGVPGPLAKRGMVNGVKFQKDK